jgi:hypothetical protein
MRKATLAASLTLALALGGCSSAQLANFQTGLGNFTQGVASVNQAIGQVSQTLLSHCNDIQTSVQALADLVSVVSSSSTARQAFAANNAVVNAFCQAPPTDLKTALAATATAVVSARSAVAAVKAGN